MNRQAKHALAGLAILVPLQLAYGQQTISGMLPGSEAWYLRAPDSAAELFIFEIGRGEPVVVLHGGPGGELTYMLPAANGLETDFRFVFYDQRGSLRSRADSASISMTKHVEDLEALRQAIGAERINVLSHSAGTLLAFEYLKAHPDRVRNLVLAGALPHQSGRKYFDAEYAAWWSTLAEDAKRFAERPAVQAEIRKAGLDAPERTPKQEAQLALIRQWAGDYRIERWRERLPVRVNGPASRATRATTNFEYDYGALLAGHAFPVTVINGEFDYTVGPRGSPLWKRLASRANGRVTVVVVPRAGHGVWYDQPAAFRNALRGALEKTP